jgi:ribosomal-protein-alanine N-acetyltransferase
MELETERLILREFRESDWPDVLAYQVDPLYLRYYEWIGRTPEAVQEFVGMFLAQQKERPRTKFQLAADNVASARVLARLGMRLEGRLRDKEYFKGRWWDTLLYAILEDEWREQQQDR